MKKILVAEDDAHISAMLCELLEQNGYNTTAAYSGTEALLQLASGVFSAVLLDLMLPGKSGGEVLSALRETSNIPVIVLTAKTDKQTTVELLKKGADDYIAKPFDNNELLARIETVLRRAAPPAAGALTYKNITLGPDIYDAVIDGRKIGLSKREYEILKLMMTHPAKVFTKNNLYESVWGGEFLGDDNTINVHISKLRSKLSAASQDTEYIQTVWGIGFKMAE